MHSVPGAQTLAQGGALGGWGLKVLIRAVRRANTDRDARQVESFFVTPDRCGFLPQFWCGEPSYRAAPKAENGVGPRIEKGCSAAPIAGHRPNTIGDPQLSRFQQKLQPWFNTIIAGIRMGRSAGPDFLADLLGNLAGESPHINAAADPKPHGMKELRLAFPPHKGEAAL
ncbi:MAG: hypothetical protein P8Z30_11895 [Acidobacteriota bacterium]